MAVLKAKINGAWVDIGVTGPPGPVGPIGPIGPTGPYDTTAFDAHVAAVDPHSVYLTATEGNNSFVNVGGDTMTGALTIANSAEALRLKDAAAYIAWFNGGTREGYLQGNANGLILNSETGLLRLYGAGGVSLSPAVINGYTMSESVIGYRVVCSNSSGYIFGNYINMTADVGAGWPAYIAGQNGDNYMRWWNRAGTLQSNRVEGLNSSSVWSSTALCANPGGGYAGTSNHPGGVAVIMSAVNGVGNMMYCRDSVFNANSANLAAANFSSDSSRRWKKNINPWPLRSAGAAVPRASDVVARLQPVTFESIAPDTEVPSLRRAKAWERLNRMRAAKGENDYELPIHECSIHECNGDAENPCARVHNQRRMFHGFVAEDVYEVFPEAVHLDADRLPAGVDINQLLSIAIAAIKELTERIRVLEGVSGGD